MTKKLPSPLPPTVFLGLLTALLLVNLLLSLVGGVQAQSTSRSSSSAASSSASASASTSVSGSGSATTSASSSGSSASGSTTTAVPQTTETPSTTTAAPPTPMPTVAPPGSVKDPRTYRCYLDLGMTKGDILTYFSRIQESLSADLSEPFNNIEIVTTILPAEGETPVRIGFLVRDATQDMEVFLARGDWMVSSQTSSLSEWFPVAGTFEFVQLATPAPPVTSEPTTTTAEPPTTPTPTTEVPPTTTTPVPVVTTTTTTTTTTTAEPTTTTTTTTTTAQPATTTTTTTTAAPASTTTTTAEPTTSTTTTAVPETTSTTSTTTTASPGTTLQPDETPVPSSTTVEPSTTPSPSGVLVTIAPTPIPVVINTPVPGFVYTPVPRLDASTTETPTAPSPNQFNLTLAFAMDAVTLRADKRNLLLSLVAAFELDLSTDKLVIVDIVEGSAIVHFEVESSAISSDEIFFLRLTRAVGNSSNTLVLYQPIPATLVVNNRGWTGSHSESPIPSTDVPTEVSQVPGGAPNANNSGDVPIVAIIVPIVVLFIFFVLGGIGFVIWRTKKEKQTKHPPSDLNPQTDAHGVIVIEADDGHKFTSIADELPLPKHGPSEDFSDQEDGDGSGGSLYTPREGGRKRVSFHSKLDVRHVPPPPKEAFESGSTSTGRRRGGMRSSSPARE